MTAPELGPTLDLATPVAFTQTAIDATLGSGLHDRLMWAIRPRLALRARKEWQRVRGSGARGSREGRTCRHLVAPVGRLVCSRRFGSRGSERAVVRFDREAGILRVWTAENHAVVLGRSAPAEQLLLAWAADGSAPRSPVLNELASSGGLRPSLFDVLLDRARREDAAAIGLLDERSPRAVVVASLEHSLQRLLVWHARARGIPTCLVPHAPTSLDRSYADLPVDLVLVQGSRDVEYYGAIGARTAGLRVVGGPALSVAPHAGPRPDLSRTVVFAATARLRYEGLEPALRATVRAASDHGMDVVVSPHPRQREPVERLAARLGIPFHRGRTRDLVARGPAALLAEISSGALLEAAAAGVPSGFLSGPAEYAFMPDIGIERYDRSDRLEAFLGGPKDEGRSLRERSRGWVAEAGPAAQRRIEEVLAEDLEVTDPVLDSWRIFA